MNNLTVAESLTAEAVSIMQEQAQKAFVRAGEIAALKQKKYLYPDEVEAVYAYPVKTQANHRASGIGPAFSKRGSRVVYAQKDLIRYFDSLRVRTRDQA